RHGSLAPSRRRGTADVTVGVRATAGDAATVPACLRPDQPCRSRPHGTTAAVAGSEIEESFGGVDRGNSVAAIDHERHGHQCAGVELHHVVGWVVDHGDAAAAIDTVL